MCRSTSNKVGEVPQETISDCDKAFLETVGTEKDNPWIATIQVMIEALDFHIDTGAEVSVIPDQVYKKLRSPTLTPSNQTLRGPSNDVLPVNGRFSTKLVYGDCETEQELYVAEGLHRPLLGLPAIELLKLVQRVRGGKLNPVLQFPTLFQGLGKLQREYSIKLQEGANPYALTTPRQVPIPLMKPVKAELERMEKLGVISRVSEPTDWCAGMVVVPKPNGQVRICVDQTCLNDNVCRERHPLPAVDQTLAQLAGAKVFSKLDANSGFWQIPLSPESIPHTTFITSYGHFSSTDSSLALRQHPSTSFLGTSD